MTDELEKKFDQQSWDEILTMIESVEKLNIQDSLVTKVIEFVRFKNKISYKQWKVLHDHIIYVERKNKKFKYGT